MLGFQILARADDVICDTARFPSGRLPSTTEIRVNFSFVASRREGLDKAAELLGLAIIKPTSNATPAGGRLGFETIGSFKDLIHESPSGVSRQHREAPAALQLDEPGVHRLKTISNDSRTHVTHVLCLEPWEQLAERTLSFYRKHFQLPVGAFARAIHQSSLKPDGVNMEAVAFGDPEQHMSCRTGEFGGFGAWAQIRHLKQFDGNEAMRESVRKYFAWMLNEGRQDDPLPGTVSFEPRSYLGRDYSAYHFFEEKNYAQYEAWFIEQMSEAIDIGFDDLIPHLEKMCAHFLSPDRRRGMHRGWFDCLPSLGTRPRLQ
jgi:hypothetical protein